MTNSTQDAGALPAQQAPSSFAMIRTLAGIALVSGCLLSIVYQATYAPIQRNTRERIENAVLTLLPGAVTQREVELPVPGQDTPQTVYAGYDEAGGLVGVAVEASDPGGYGGEIRVMYGYLPGREALSGMTVLLMRETPGLGDRIRTDPDFNERFEGLEVPLAPDGDSLAYPITFVESGADPGPGEIDGISGATVSSRAVVRAVRHSAERLLPEIQRHLDALQKGTL